MSAWKPLIYFFKRAPCSIFESHHCYFMKSFQDDEWNINKLNGRWLRGWLQLQMTRGGICVPRVWIVLGQPPSSACWLTCAWGRSLLLTRLRRCGFGSLKLAISIVKDVGNNDIENEFLGAGEMALIIKSMYYPCRGPKLCGSRGCDALFWHLQVLHSYIHTYRDIYKLM